MKKIKTIKIPNEKDLILYRGGLFRKNFFLYRFCFHLLPLGKALNIIEGVEWGMKNPPSILKKPVFHLGGHSGYRLDVSGYDGGG